MFEQIKSWSAVYIGMINALTKQPILESSLHQDQTTDSAIKNKSTGIIKASIVAFFIIFSLGHGSAYATPCSCWDSGTTVSMGATCWAAWDTGKFSRDFLTPSDDDLKFGAAMGGGAFIVQILTIGAVIDTEASAAGPLGAAVAGAALVATIIFALTIGGIQDMEACRQACQTANEFYNLNQWVWWYADPTALNACMATHPELVNKY